LAPSVPLPTPTPRRWTARQPAAVLTPTAAAAVERENLIPDADLTMFRRLDLPKFRNEPKRWSGTSLMLVRVTGPRSVDVFPLMADRGRQAPTTKFMDAWQSPALL